MTFKFKLLMGVIVHCATGTIKLMSLSQCHVQNSATAVLIEVCNAMVISKILFKPLEGQCLMIYRIHELGEVCSL